uniref:C2H2-type domain-containing protein n=1 Tax=Anopheles atroparvus TaxID=41427 RepID=A0A182IU79_ANOAO
MSETQFVCDLCRQHYSTFEILMTHNRLKHYHTIKFGCGYCNETFRNEDDLYCHFVLTHHIDPYGQPTSDDCRRSRSNSEVSDESEECTGGPMRLISESDDGSVESAEANESSSAEGEYDDDDDGACSEDGSDAELNYNELYMRRKRSAMTQEEISELTDVFKKTVQATYTTKFRL